MTEEVWCTVAWLVFILAFAALLGLGVLARGADAITLTARAGEAFYLPVALPCDDRQPLAALDAAVTVTPAGILRPEYASGPRRCLATLGPRRVAVVCAPARRITGPPVQLVYTAVAAGTATVTLTECRVGEAHVACPPPVEVEVRP